MNIDEITKAEARAYLYKLCPFMQYDKVDLYGKNKNNVLDLIAGRDCDRGNSLHVFEETYKFSRDREVHVFEYCGASGIDVQIWTKQKE